jgi:hypothetical protein
MVGKLLGRVGLLAIAILVVPHPSWSADSSDGPSSLREIKKEIRELATDRQRALEKIERLAKRYDLTSAEMMQMRCNYCHRHDVATPGMEQINAAKKLFKAKKCIVCHTVEGRGGATAPEITYFGDMEPELIDFSHMSGARTLFNWNYEHLMEPDKISPHTTMPTFNFQPEEARELTLLLLSWRREIFPPEYIPAPLEALPSPSPSASAALSPSATPSPTTIR